jgi:hypothetical protein
MIAMLAACGIVAIGRIVEKREAVPVAAALLMAYAAVRIYRDYPALDRSADARPTDVLESLTSGLDDRREIFLTDLNWQLDNGLSYFTKEIRPAIADARMPDVLPYLPALVRDNAAIGRSVAVTERARAEAAAAYGPLFSFDRDVRVPTPSFPERVAALARGTRYVLIVLKPTREFSIDAAEYGRAVSALTGGRGPISVPQAPYGAIAGIVGAAPVLARFEATPFRATATVGGTPLLVRMDAWLSADTIRRMGFAHAIAARHHTLIAERGVSFATFDSEGRPTLTVYAAGLFAPQARYLIRSR